jgi:SLT domain-containing protein
MAELAKLDIQIGADVKDATRGINDLNRSLSKLEFPAAKLKKGAADASAALFSVSQVARDLPFGFIAIQNNLPQVVDSFAALSKQSGGTLNALKALGGSLLGPAGIGFAFSVVTSAVTSLISKYGSLSAGLDAVFSATSSAERAQRAISKAFDEASAGAASEIISIRQLTTALSDNNRSQEERLNAYLTLKKEYPGIIQDMTFENSLTEEGARLLEARSKELVRYIILKGKEAALVKLVEEETKKQLQTQKDLDTQLAKTPNPLSFFNPLAFNQVAAIGKLGVAVDKAAQNTNYYADALVAVKDELLGIDGAVSGLIKKDIAKAVTPKLAKIKAIEVPFALGKLETVGGRTADQIVNDQFKIQNGINIPIKLDTNSAAAEKTFADFTAKLYTYADQIRDIWQQLSYDIEYTLQEGFSNALAGIGEAVADAINGKGFSGLKKVFAAIGDTLIQVGKYAIQTGVKVIALKRALAVLFANPALSIAAGIALTALGSIVKSKFAGGGITGFAQGGVVTQPTLAMIGEAGEKEAVIPLSKLNNLVGGMGGGNLQAVVKGSDLLFVMNRAQKNQGRGF